MTRTLAGTAIGWSKVENHLDAVRWIARARGSAVFGVAALEDRDACADGVKVSVRNLWLWTPNIERHNPAWPILTNKFLEIAQPLSVVTPMKRKSPVVFLGMWQEPLHPYRIVRFVTTAILVSEKHNLTFNEIASTDATAQGADEMIVPIKPSPLWSRGGHVP